MTDLSKETVMVISSPLFCSLAERLARDFGKTYLYIPVAGSFVTMNLGMVGTGLEGVEKVQSVFGPHFDKVTLFVFPDLGHSALQIYLEKLGKRVWGNRNAEELEVYREVCKKQMEKLGLPVQPWQVIQGIKNLREHLKAHDNQHVKIDQWRGLTETFFSSSYANVETKLDELERDLGGFKEMAQFIVEDDLPDRVEIGLDYYTVDGQFPRETLVGIEAKDCGYVAQFMPYDAIPEPIRRWTDTMAPVLATYGARGFLSNEVRIGKDKVPYMIDACMRAGSPPSELYQEFYLNLPQILWEGADGVMVDPEPIAKWGVQVVLKSSWSSGHWQPVTIDPKWEKNLKLFNCVVIDGQRYVVPLDEEMAEIGAVIGWGETMEEALKMATEAGESVQGYGIKFGTGSIDDIQEEIAKLEKMGVSPFGAKKLKAKATTGKTLRSGKKVLVKTTKAPGRVKAK